MNRVQAIIAAAASTALATAAIATTAVAQGVFDGDHDGSQSNTELVASGTPQVVYRDLDPIYVDQSGNTLPLLDAGSAGSFEVVSAQADSGDSWHDDDDAWDDDHDDDDDDDDRDDHDDDDDHHDDHGHDKHHDDDDDDD